MRFRLVLCVFCIAYGPAASAQVRPDDSSKPAPSAGQSTPARSGVQTPVAPPVSAPPPTSTWTGAVGPTSDGLFSPIVGPPQTPLTSPPVVPAAPPPPGTPAIAAAASSMSQGVTEAAGEIATAAGRACGAAGSTPTSGGPSGGAASQGVGVSASLFPRAGVAAEKFERPGVSAAQLATLLPGGRSARCDGERPRDLPLLNQEPVEPRRLERFPEGDD